MHELASRELEYFPFLRGHKLPSAAAGNPACFIAIGWFRIRAASRSARASYCCRLFQELGPFRASSLQIKATLGAKIARNSVMNERMAMMVATCPILRQVG